MTTRKESKSLPQTHFLGSETIKIAFCDNALPQTLLRELTTLHRLPIAGFQGAASRQGGR